MIFCLERIYVVITAHFDDLDPEQRLALFTFAILANSDLPNKEALAEGLFEHLYNVLVNSDEPVPLPLLTLEGKETDVLAILNAQDQVAMIHPFDSECAPLVVHPEVPPPPEDKNPYTILGAKRYGEDNGDEKRRLLILARIDEERAEYYGTEPMMVALDFDLAEEDAPMLYEMPLDLGQALFELMIEHWMSDARPASVEQTIN